MRHAFAAVALLGPVVSAGAADAPYLDDRSGPAELIRSLYNAIERREYARAYSYFSTPPAASLDAYAQGYADTESVTLRTGMPSEEGAAGSIYYQLPVAIEARAANGDVRVYGGCYTLRLSNPQIQAEDFIPLHIESGSLSSSDSPLDEALPNQCGDAPPAEPALILEQRAKSLFREAFGELCERKDDAGDGAFTAYTFTFRQSYQADNDPPREAHLYRFLCNRGAYNETHVYILANEYDELAPLSFAEPDLNIRYVDDDHEKAVESITIQGFKSRSEMVNSEFDPQTLTLSAHGKWRGIGDASSGGSWIFRDGAFTLAQYDADASYDGEINPETVLDYQTGP